MSSESSDLALRDASRLVPHPTFFLVGASRAGTTSLYAYLRQHPDVFMPSGPRVKEPAFFCDAPPAWAAAYRSVEAYLALFANAGNAKAIGEATTPYLVSPETPRRIRSVYPDAKIIIILRNPVDRAYSLWRFLCSHGLEWITSFEAALGAEEARAEGKAFRGETPFWAEAYLYFRTGLYSQYLERYFATFPAAQIRVVLFDDMLRSAEETTHELWRFLGLDSTPPVSVQVHNRGEFPFFVALQYQFARHWRQHPLRQPGPRARLTDKIMRRAMTVNNRLGRARNPRLDISTRRRLIQLYSDDIQRTARLINRNLSAWLNSSGSRGGGPMA